MMIHLRRDWFRVSLAAAEQKYEDVIYSTTTTHHAAAEPEQGSPPVAMLRGTSGTNGINVETLPCEKKKNPGERCKASKTRDSSVGDKAGPPLMCFQNLPTYQYTQVWVWKSAGGGAVCLYTVLFTGSEWRNNSD